MNNMRASSPKPPWSKSKGFKVSVRKAGRKTLIGRPRISPLFKDEPETPGMINGQMATNLYEWRAAKALWALKVKFDYQVSYNGGRGRAGGQVIDFIVYTAPIITALYIDGEYWHEGQRAREDTLKRAMVEHDGYNVISLFGNEVHTQDAAIDSLRRKLGIYL